MSLENTMANVFPSDSPLEPLLRESVGSTRKMFFRFFKILEEEFERKVYQAAKVFNVEETGLCIVQSQQPDVVGLRGTREVSVIT
jgi:hypothetical protein